MRRAASHAPRPSTLWAIALLALAAAGGGIAITLTSDHVSEPGWQAGLLSWITLTFVLSGLVAWSRRPESRFGPMMIAAGFATSLTMLSSSDAALPFTIGQALDLLPAILFLHVFLAFPTGRLEHRAERALVAAGYVIAVASPVARSTTHSSRSRLLSTARISQRATLAPRPRTRRSASGSSSPLIDARGRRRREHACMVHAMMRDA